MGRSVAAAGDRSRPATCSSLARVSVSRVVNRNSRRARTTAPSEWEIKLQRKFGTMVAIVAGGKGGKVEFEYYGQEDLERLLEAWGVL